MNSHSYPVSPISKEHNLTVENLKEFGYVYWREVDGVLYAIVEMTFNKGRLLIDCNRTGYEDFYCFPTVDRAVKALIRYADKVDTEFTDWHRHFSSDRRRKDGDPSTEFINF